MPSPLTTEDTIFPGGNSNEASWTGDLFGSELGSKFLMTNSHLASPEELSSAISKSQHEIFKIRGKFLAHTGNESLRRTYAFAVS